MTIEVFSIGGIVYTVVCLTVGAIFHTVIQKFWAKHHVTLPQK